MTKTVKKWGGFIWMGDEMTLSEQYTHADSSLDTLLLVRVKIMLIAPRAQYGLLAWLERHRFLVFVVTDFSLHYSF